MKVRGVFPVGILLILLLGGSSSFAQKYKGYIAEYKVNELIYSEGYQQGISLEKTKTCSQRKENPNLTLQQKPFLTKLYHIPLNHKV